MRRNITASIDEKPLKVYNHSVQRSIDSFWINNTQKPSIILASGIYRFYQTDPTNYYGTPSPFIIGTLPETQAVDNSYIKYFLNGQQVNATNYINNFTPCLTSYFGNPQLGNYVEITCTYTNPVTSYFYYNANQVGYGNNLKYLPTDNCNIFVCLSTTTSLELFAGQHSIYIPIKLAYVGLPADNTYYDYYSGDGSIYRNLTAFNMHVMNTEAKTVTAYTLSAFETLLTQTESTSSIYAIRPLGFVPSLCATVIETIKIKY